MLGICLMAAQLVASQEGLTSLKLVILLCCDLCVITICESSGKLSLLKKVDIVAKMDGKLQD
jgi:hypothetical protein